MNSMKNPRRRSVALPVLATLVTLTASTAGCADSSTTETTPRPAQPTRVSASTSSSPDPGCIAGSVGSPRPLPSRYRHLLAERGFELLTDWLRIGSVVVISAQQRGKANPHNQVTYFFHGSQLVASDSTRRQRTHFSAVICSVKGHSLTTGYQVNIGPTGHLSGCPAAGWARVRWQVKATRVIRQDPIPGRCSSRV